MLKSKCLKLGAIFGMAAAASTAALAVAKPGSGITPHTLVAVALQGNLATRRADTQVAEIEIRRFRQIDSATHTRSGQNRQSSATHHQRITSST